MAWRFAAIREACRILGDFRLAGRAVYTWARRAAICYAASPCEEWSRKPDRMRY